MRIPRAQGGQRPGLEKYTKILKKGAIATAILMRALAPIRAREDLEGLVEQEQEEPIREEYVIDGPQHINPVAYVVSIDELRDAYERASHRHGGRMSRYHTKNCAAAK